ncbi:cilia- and flagella-associated protein 221 [Entelurus aequoreus]|uniref:cilia- and flagella-associated protein 221 n=1 Tax=Entelurus aequoreus TaxID=161455 RepID=UPI002B1D9FC2|nr:cilia- and flagella-associated protein 221 [Entelurus aequoreus]XP_061915398.1 cilia- and flagella-associated protein 221 [Entelurus aequoreus]XP_061915410.1 cilia- and flagella-associated protein 221 [Entelurus aequoreus]XP_061915420.1 cilia- and flagella-associated protein 221 [Entelurus aequoreus]XP_061915430.1 cilia- and flagella-associated protein 221 [Entelurus aequoreus]XP_061915445.1 cilia- and flagella-associated protein 221 [Entelurus aequoreus]XP_061915455.1 cilia- and flagella-
MALSAPLLHTDTLGSGTPPPLRHLVEKGGSRVPNHLLESKVYFKEKSNSLIEVDPPEIHFTGFKLEKDYARSVKLINISSRVLNIHIIPTQSKHFRTTYAKKCRLIPGLAYTVKVRFCPHEWARVSDCIRVHCEADQNLLIPVYAYPSTAHVQVPPRIDLPPTPLGQSVSHVIPLSCRSPNNLEFQVDLIEPNEAFSISPLSGVIPANGQAMITVAFKPCRYETSQVTVRLVVSQFNTKSYLCTITGSSAPLLALREMDHRGTSAKSKGSLPAIQVSSQVKTLSPVKQKSTKDDVKAKPAPKPLVDASTHTGVAKILQKDLSKLCLEHQSEDLQDRQKKEALFLKKVQQNDKEEQTNRLRVQVHQGKDPVTEATRCQVLEERKVALQQYKVRKGEVRQEDDFTSGPPKLYSIRLICDAGQTPKGAPVFQFHPSFQWELKERAIKLFQQAARKVVMQCRLKRILAFWRKLPDITASSLSAQKVEEEEASLMKIPADRIFPSSFPLCSHEADSLALPFAAVPVDAVDVKVTTHVPTFKLQVPQYYKTMEYQPVSAWEAFNSFIPTTLARPLRNPDPDSDSKPPTPGQDEEQDASDLNFTFPGALLRPIQAHPLRIFNPAPGLQAYKPTPKYLESDVDFHLCPLPRYSTAEGHTSGMESQTLHTQALDPKGEITGLKTWDKFDLNTATCLSKQAALTSNILNGSTDFNKDLLPVSTPAAFTHLPAYLSGEADKKCDSKLTPEMIRLEFLAGLQ